MFSLYGLRNKITGEIYVGLTCQNPWTLRAHRHFCESELKDSNRKIYKSIKTFGRNNFDIFLISQNHDQELAMKAEAYLVNLYMNEGRSLNTYPGGVYSTSLRGNKFCVGKQHALGQKRSEETKELISSTRRKKSVVRIDSETGREMFFDSLSDAIHALGKTTGTNRISQVCGLKNRTAFGYQWRWSENAEVAA